MLDIRICKDEQDIHILAQCAKSIWNEYFIDIITQEQIDYMVDKFQSYPALTKAINEEQYTYFLAFDEDVCFGYCGIRVDQERLFLSKLYVAKTYRGKGLSSKLFQKAKEFAHEQHCISIYLTCNKYNQHSLDVYKHHGFQCIDSVQTDIGRGFIMDDYILELIL